MSSRDYKRRRSLVIAVIGIAISSFLWWRGLSSQNVSPDIRSESSINNSSNTAPDRMLAKNGLSSLEIKGRAQKTGYSRNQFGDGWADWKDCDTRQQILARDLVDIELDDDGCTVISGILNDPYSGEVIKFRRGETTSSIIQIDHVVALSDAWQKGAQALSFEKRQQLANDSLELLAVSGTSNQQKSDSDAASWLPKNKSFRCQYVARQIAVKLKYNLWVTQAEHDTMLNILNTCPQQLLPGP